MLEMTLPHLLKYSAKIVVYMLSNLQKNITLCSHIYMCIQADIWTGSTLVTHQSKQFCILFVQFSTTSCY